MAVGIIDYGMCNLGSVRRAFEECGADVVMATEPSHLKDITHMVLPGVGAYSKGMANLHSMGWVNIIREKALNEKIPLLGICLGMQLLSDLGEEGGKSEGLSLIKGKVIRFADISQRIPHVGWNEIEIQSEHPLLKGINSGTDFYFVHSFHFNLSEEGASLARTPYGFQFHSIVAHENIMGVQFHPEKSSKPGFKLIKNFLEI